MDDQGPLQQPASAMEVKIWGARGSVPTPTPDHLGVGGNTSCLEVRVATGENFILDAGTGIRMLGLAGEKEQARDLHIFLTHFHWDHLQGLPFFTPLYSARNTITFHSARPVEELRGVLRGQMVNPYFPIPFDQVAATLDFRQIDSVPTLFGNAEISSFALHHPGGAHGYSIAAGGARIVHATDHEHGDPRIDAGLLATARGADILIYDAEYTPEEYATHVGWGHSTWVEATRVAAAAGVKQLVLFHHNPGHTDQDMQRILEMARQHFPNTSLAIEGTVVSASPML